VDEDGEPAWGVGDARSHVQKHEGYSIVAVISSRKGVIILVIIGSWKEKNLSLMK
jgi:hypothetical protein